MLNPAKCLLGCNQVIAMQLKYDLFFWHKELTEEQIWTYFGYGSSDDSENHQDVMDIQIPDSKLEHEIEINSECDVEFSNNPAKQSSEQQRSNIDLNPKKRRRRQRRSKPKVLI
ncbi:hypothetical protein H6G64_31145 [Calothrix sp. FACHB-156]|nr:hypothetical protein [Calothrix sp. FACHB-156]